MAKEKVQTKSMKSKAALNIALVKQAVSIAEGNRRQSTSNTKTRGEVSGGGRKPWRQKGTGRARAGSSRSPIWVGGGVTFGPAKERNHKRHLPKKMAASALSQLLTHLQQEQAVVIADKLQLTAVKTKQAMSLLVNHGLAGKRVLIVTAEIAPELVLACRNIPGVTVVENRNLSILDLAHAQAVLIDRDSASNRGLVKTEPKKAETKKTTKKTS